MSDVWSQHAQVYDLAFRPILETFARDAMTLSGLASKKGLCVLDVACGSGAMTLPLLKGGHIVTATDFSQEMLNIVEQRATQADFKDLKTILADGQTLEGIPDSHFDAVVSSFGIFLFPDRVQGWKSAHRVLKNGAILAALSWSNDSPNLLMIDRIMGRTSSFQSGNQTLDVEGFKNEVAACGFESVSVTKIKHEFCFTSGRFLLDSMLDNPVFRKATETAGRDMVSKEMADFLGLSVDVFLKTPVHFEGIALFCLAQKSLF